MNTPDGQHFAARHKRRHRVAVAAAAVLLSATAAVISGSSGGRAGSTGAGSTKPAPPARAVNGPPSTAEPGLRTTTSFPATTTSAAASTFTSVRATTLGRPFTIVVPASYARTALMPVVVELHGYGGSSAGTEASMGLSAVAATRGFLLVLPDGKHDRAGAQFWNATDACCDAYGANVDDSTYLMSVIQTVQRTYRVDPRRVYVVGHSNGGFMAYRMACDHAQAIAAIVSVAGATFADPSRCAPAAPVSVLEVHGTADDTIRYDGGRRDGHTYPGAHATVATWAAYDGCNPAVRPAGSLDLAQRLPGRETSVSVYDGCRRGSRVELFTIDRGSHVPVFSTALVNEMVDFLFAHPKPAGIAALG